jgi:hypothetical protein
MMLLAEPAGRSLERTGNRASRGMTVHDRTRLIGQLLLFDTLLISGTWKEKRGFNIALKPRDRSAS